MTKRHSRQYEMLVRVRDFGSAFGHLFPPSSVAAANFAAVDAAIKELDAQDVAHLAASVSARAQRKDAACHALLTRLQAISQTARVLCDEIPGLDHEFEVPTGASDVTLLTIGRKFARGAGTYSRQFIAHGMPTTFLADLNALVDGFDKALRDRGLGREARRAARVSTKAILSAGIAAVHSLNVIVINHLAGDAVATTVWNGAQRIVYRKRTDPAREPAPAPATPAPAGTRAA